MRNLAVLLSLVLASTLTACGGGDDSTGPSDSYSGTYTLRTVNGQNLPFIVLQVGTDKLELVSDKFVLVDNGSGGSFTQQTAFRLTENGQVSNETETDAGDYFRNGTAVTFEFISCDCSWVGTMGGGKITVVDEGLVLVYQK